MSDRCLTFALAGMHVPKTSMRVDNPARAGQNDIQGSGKAAAMEAEAIT
jgi:hypothetical protein